MIRSVSQPLMLACLLAGLATAQPTAFTPLDPFDQIKTMARGVNIIGYDPLWRDFDRARFKERHFQRIHDGGFQTVRVNLQAISHMGEANRLDVTWLKTTISAAKMPRPASRS